MKTKNFYRMAERASVGYIYNTLMLFPFISFLPSPLDSEPPSIDDEFVEGLLSCHFSRLPRGKLDESTLLPLDYGNGANLTKLVKVTPAIKTEE